MARPPLSDDKKRKNVSISLRQDVLSLANETDNKSRFFEQSVEVCRGIAEVMRDLRRKKLKTTIALEEIEDMIDAWEAQFEEKSPYTMAAARRDLRKTGS